MRDITFPRAARQLVPIAAQAGIDITYTEDVGNLNLQTLNQYDDLLIYANITVISQDHEKALLDYVEGGHGLVVLHCGSYCFLNSPKYIALVGGAVSQTQHRRVPHDDRRAGSSDHAGVQGF